MVSWWCTRLFEEDQTLKPPELACLLSWALLDENVPPVFCTLLGGLLGPHFNTLDLFTSLSIRLAGFLLVGLIYFISFSVSSEGVTESQLLRGGHSPCRGTRCMGADVAVQAGNTRGWARGSWAALPVG